MMGKSSVSRTEKMEWIITGLSFEAVFEKPWIYISTVCNLVMRLFNKRIYDTAATTAIVKVTAATTAIDTFGYRILTSLNV